MKKKVFIAINSMEFGGIQKSLLSFLNYIKDKADIDILVWYENFQLKLPDYVNVLDVPRAFSVSYAFRKYSLLNKHFYISVLGRFFKHSWKAMRKIKKQYDIAICYSNVSNIKYFTIDNILAGKKYAFYHHGSYEFNNRVKKLDLEYYPKYDKVFAVSKSAKKMLLREFDNSFKVSVCPNLIDIDNIKSLAEEPCEIMDKFRGLKLLTVGRLSEEKNPFFLLEIAKNLAEKKIDFKWFVVGDGVLFNELNSKIQNAKLENHFVLTGNQANPYKFMKRCDTYVQTSKFEADPITIKEVAIFNKSMLLSDIVSFNNCKDYINNIQTFNSANEFAEAIARLQEINIKNNSIDNLNRETRFVIDKILEG